MWENAGSHGSDQRACGLRTATGYSHTKHEIALAAIDRVRAAGVRFGRVLADAGYELSATFRQALTARGLTWAVSIPFKQKVYPADVAMIFPLAGRRRPGKRHIATSLERSKLSLIERTSPAGL